LFFAPQKYVQIANKPIWGFANNSVKKIIDLSKLAYLHISAFTYLRSRL